MGRDGCACGPGVDGQVVGARRQPVDQRVALQVERGGGGVVEFDEFEIIVAGGAGLHLADDQRRGWWGRRRCAGRQGE